MLKRKSWKYAHHHILAFCGYLFRGEDVSIKFVISRYAHPAAAHSHIKISCFVVFRGQTNLGVSCEPAGHSIQLGWSWSKFSNDRQWYEIFCRRSAALLSDKKMMLSCSFVCSSKPLCILRRQMAILFNLDETGPSFERTLDDTKFFDVQSPSCPINLWLTANEMKFFVVLSPCCPIKILFSCCFITQRNLGRFTISAGSAAQLGWSYSNFWIYTYWLKIFVVHSPSRR